MEIVVQEGIEELVVIEELLEDPELAELEKCDALAPLYHVECIGLHIRSLCSHTSSIWRLARMWQKEEGRNPSSLHRAVVAAGPSWKCCFDISFRDLRKALAAMLASLPRVVDRPRTRTRARGDHIIAVLFIT